MFLNKCVPSSCVFRPPQLVWALVRQGLAGPGLLEAAAGSLAAGAHRLTLREAAMVASAYADARWVGEGSGRA